MITLATFNVENLMRRFDYSGFRNELHQDRSLKLFEIRDAIFPPGQEVGRYPRTGWDRPKASDHCPVTISLNLL